LSPTWTNTFTIDYSLGKPTHINVGIWDGVRNINDKAMGSAMFEIGDVLGSSGVKAKRLQKGGTLFVRIVKASPSSGMLHVSSVRGSNLASVEGGFFNKSDPFFEISKKVNGPGGYAWTIVYRSEYVKDSLNPRWNGFEVSMDQLCGGDQSQPILISVFDNESSGRHVPMGSVETCVSALAGYAATFTLRGKKGKSAGTIEFAGVELPSSSRPVPQPTLANAPYASPVPVMMPPPAASRPFAPPNRPTFVDYVSGGCELHMCVAIDFTGSNGECLLYFYVDALQFL